MLRAMGAIIPAQNKRWAAQAAPPPTAMRPPATQAAGPALRQNPVEWRSSCRPSAQVARADARWSAAEFGSSSHSRSGRPPSGAQRRAQGLRRQIDVPPARSWDSRWQAGRRVCSPLQFQRAQIEARWRTRVHPGRIPVTATCARAAERRPSSTVGRTRRRGGGRQGRWRQVL